MKAPKEAGPQRSEDPKETGPEEGGPQGKGGPKGCRAPRREGPKGGRDRELIKTLTECAELETGILPII